MIINNNNYYNKQEEQMLAQLVFKTEKYNVLLFQTLCGLENGSKPSKLLWKFKDQ